MFYITTSDNCGISWHVGQQVPEVRQPSDPSFPRRYIKEIYVDGNELEYLLKLVPNLQEVANVNRRSFAVSWVSAVILHALLVKLNSD